MGEVTLRKLNIRPRASFPLLRPPRIEMSGSDVRLGFFEGSTSCKVEKHCLQIG